MSCYPNFTLTNLFSFVSWGQMLKIFLLAILAFIALTIFRIYFFLKKNLKVYRVDYRPDEEGFYSPRIRKEKDISDQVKVIKEENP